VAAPSRRPQPIDQRLLGGMPQIRQSHPLEDLRRQDNPADVAAQVTDVSPLQVPVRV
jgi:hypothetical protein